MRPGVARGWMVNRGLRLTAQTPARRASDVAICRGLSEAREMRQTNPIVSDVERNEPNRSQRKTSFLCGWQGNVPSPVHAADETNPFDSLRWLMAGRR